MYNTNSPIINNMYQQNTMYGMQQGIPYNPIGSIVNIGNTGYYGNSNNGYNRFLDPFQLRRQHETQMAQERENLRVQSDIMKNISKNINKALGAEPSEEYLNRYNPTFEQYQQQDPDEVIYDRLMNVEQTGYINYNPYLAQQIVNANVYCDMMKQKYPDDMTMYDFYENSYELVIDAMTADSRAKEKDLTQLYNRNGYSDLIKMHGKTSQYFNTILRGNEQAPKVEENIDDISISLSNHLVTESMQRKSAFMQSIMEQRG